MPHLPNLLPIEASAGPQVRSLRTWNAAGLSRMGAKVQTALQKWCLDFGLRGDASADSSRPVVCELLSEASRQPDWVEWNWNALSTPHESGLLWWAIRRGESYPGSTDRVEEAKAALFDALFGERPDPFQRDRMADEVMQAAWMDWWQRLALLFGADQDVTSIPSELPADQLRPWSGALVVALPWCGQTMMLVLSHTRISTCLGRQAPAPSRAPSAPPLVPVLRAASMLTLPLHVDLEPAAIDLGSLASLSRGDILRTSHALESPLIVRSAARPGEADPEGAPLCRGYLGKRGNLLAVELVPQA